MSADFLLELLSEEIPARMQAKARNDLARLFVEALSSAGLPHQNVTTYSTPRRLALIARGLPASTDAVSEEVKGPRISAPPQALEGFLRKTRLSQDQLTDRDGVWFAVIERPGRPAVDVLAEAVATIVREFPWPKSMRWGGASASTSSLRWVRPLHSIVALLGEEIVPVAVEGVSCGATTLGHRFHHPGVITIGGAHDYVEKLRACHVLVDQEEREAIVRSRSSELADDAGYFLVEDEGLVVENSGLTEYPVPLLGSFDPDFLDVPEEVIQLTARINQKYFVLRDPGTGKLAPHFVCTANIAARDGGDAILAGNERVLAARLSDARFFWEHDLKTPLQDQAAKLGQIIFHEKLGTLSDRVDRIADLARWLAEQGVVEGADPQLVERAARLSKADLVTGMVGEFPELQGVIGGYLAAAQGEAPAVADAVRDHYKPIGQSDTAPTAPVTVAVSVAEKLDTLACFFLANLLPTGSKDPFALRRAALGLLDTVLENKLRFDVAPVAKLCMARVDGKLQGSVWLQRLDDLMKARADGGDPVGRDEYNQLRADYAHRAKAEGKASFVDRSEKATDLLRQFLADRLKVQQREAGVRHDLIDAVFALGGEDDIVRLLARVNALQAFVETEEGANLLAGYKRAANILKKEHWTGRKGVMAAPGSQGISQTGEEDPLALVEEPAIAAAVAEMAEARRSHDALLPEETTLLAALDQAESAARAAVAAEDFTAAMAALAKLRVPIDAFFDKVTVNDNDEALRARRLNLLLRFRNAVGEVADFARIEG